MKKMVETVLQRYGMAVQVVHDGISSPVKAFFQPHGAKNVGSKVTPLGVTEQGQYLYMGPAGQYIEAGDDVIVDGVRYLVKRAESCRDGAGTVYRWALCAKKGGEDTWASQV